MTESAPPSRAEQTRAHLVEAARCVFAEQGYHDAPVAAITDAALTAHGTFYRYFANKEEAFLTVMAELLEELYHDAFTPLDQLGDRFDAEQVRERIAAFLNTSVRHGRLWRALLEAVLASPAVEARWQAGRHRFTADLAARFAHLSALGALRPVDTTQAAVLLAGMLEWHVVTLVAFDDATEPLEVPDATIDLICDLWFHAAGRSARAGCGQPPRAV